MQLKLRKTWVEREFIGLMVRNGFLYRFDGHYKEHGGYRFTLPVHQDGRGIRLFINREVLMVEDISLYEPLKRHVESQLYEQFGYTFKRK